MIGKTALALAAAAFISSCATLLVAAAGYALFLALQPLLAPAGAAACVAAAALTLLLIAIGIARMQHVGKHDAPTEALRRESMVATFAAAMKQRPLLLLGLTGLTGLAAARNPDSLRSIVGALVPASHPH